MKDATATPQKRLPEEMPEDMYGGQEDDGISLEELYGDDDEEIETISKEIDHTDPEQETKPKNKEIKLSDRDLLTMKVDKYGKIDYINRTYKDISGYKESELRGKMHDVIRHPDMPKAIFRYLWEIAEEQKPFTCIFKNISADRKYFWTIENIEPKTDIHGRTTNFMVFGNKVEEKAKEEFSHLFSAMKKLEEARGEEASYQYLQGFLLDHKITLSQYAISINIKEKGGIFTKIKKLFK